ncbi:MAG: type II toxin-antitoxin system Phd/YefM family antitoxin [Chloroflexi bacterium]|nr:type II toxin-antitoxin system Phd/YefM family antitoxin [Chloroflexota bacterium]
MSRAKDSLDEVLAEALAGETIVIMRENQPVLLQPRQIPPPLPRRPPGCFDDRYTDKAAFTRLPVQETETSTRTQAKAVHE